MMEGFDGMDSEAEEETDGDSESEEEVEEVITVEMTEAWSPDGYHSSSEMVWSRMMDDTDHENGPINDPHWHDHLLSNRLRNPRRPAL